MKRLIIITLQYLLLSILLTSCYPKPDSKLQQLDSHQSNTLNVGLYPYVPRIDQFKKALSSHWNKLHPDIALTYSDKWDGGYDLNPDDDLDVFVFDALFFENFLNKGYLDPIKANEINNISDFVDYAIQGVKSGEEFYAIPQLGCANILFYKKGDTEIANAKSITELKTALNQCSYTSQIPPDQRGLMLDLQGGTTNASYYLDITHGLNNQYPFPLPGSSDDLNPVSIDNMKTLLTIASFPNATQSPPKTYGRAEWFSNGYGRSMIGFTEHMSAMSNQTRKNIDFKPLPISANSNSPVFYADVIAINPKTRTRNTRELALELANLMASTTVMIDSIGTDRNHPYPQYLMSTRPSVFKALGQTFPIYNKMYNMIESHRPIMFKLSSDSRNWLHNMKSVIRTEAQKNYSCGCDQVVSTRIISDAAASQICQFSCKNYGGWNHQWTNKFPAAPKGKSVCGCNTCPL